MRTCGENHETHDVR